MVIRIKRVYDAKHKADGFRVLVDRLWPRGLTKKQTGVDLWLKDIAPSRDLRKWFSHDPEKWDQFKRKYFAELEANRETVEQVMRKAREKGGVTLLFAARDQIRNNAVVLKEFLERKSKETEA
jgi:uncharacterized protein YeaO (DUF488 family)